MALVRVIYSELEAHVVEGVFIRVADEGVTIGLSDMRFIPDTAELPESEQAKLREIGRILQGISMRRIIISGHTALAGTEESQLRVSLERAQTVADFMVSQGVRNRDEIEIRGYGSQQPIADNSTAEGMAANRRVEITIVDGR
jgi:outer membrane protein OmpA-like peptidoglycan-associated protein